MEQASLQIGQQLRKRENGHAGYYVTDKTANSVEVFLPRIVSKDKNKIGIDCLGWFSNVQNNKGESDFNKTFELA